MSNIFHVLAIKNKGAIGEFLVAVTSLRKCMKTAGSRKYLRIKELIFKKKTK